MNVPVTTPRLLKNVLATASALQFMELEKLLIVVS
jgi:hypothetical protein